jgi:glycosyltransferase involved in cell wall biosynthesis
MLERKRLKVLTAGTFSLRKGAIDLVNVAAELKDRMDFTMVGDVAADAADFAERARDSISFLPRVPHQELPRIYASADLFLFPTIEDGFALVLAQAGASALPTITTTHCCGPDLIADDKTGWVLPIRSPERLVERLLWCDAHREELAAMVQTLYEKPPICTWGDAARNFLALLAEARAQSS